VNDAFKEGLKNVAHRVGPRRHGPATMRAARTPEAVVSRCNFQVVRTMEDGRMELFATGKYLDEIVLDSGSAKLKERVVVLDSRNVDILMVIPL
jgi:3-phenylpropionate/cinnamic acid dioxygenase small subunit